VVSDGSDGIFEQFVADLCVHGVWQPQAKALFDIRVVDTMPGHIVVTPLLLCCLVLRLKRNGSIHYTELPCFLYVSVDSLLRIFVQQLSDSFSLKWEQPFSVV